MRTVELEPKEDFYKCRYCGKLVIYNKKEDIVRKITCLDINAGHDWELRVKCPSCEHMEMVDYGLF